ncbi:hypothetical protein KAT45_01760, partial [Candidatus Aerophobetes bacterium]|nr:hypothetical protein [Candidatus Aerophobetes bacterium]
MRGKKLLAAFLLGVGLCFVPVLGQGEVTHYLHERKTSSMNFWLLNARVSYMMHNPNSFLNVNFHYDPVGDLRGVVKFPEGVDIDTKGKIHVLVRDNRGVFSYKSGRVLLNQFKRQLELIYSFIELMATDMDIDIVAKLVSREQIPLAYFYQGEYHLW